LCTNTARPSLFAQAAPVASGARPEGGRRKNGWRRRRLPVLIHPSSFILHPSRRPANLAGSRRIGDAGTVRLSLFRKLLVREHLPTSLTQLPGATPERVDRLARLGLSTIGDLLFHFPRAYEDLTDLRPIAALTAGRLQTVVGEIVEMDTRHLNDGKF